MRVDINNLLNFFRLFLERNLSNLCDFMEDELINDWLQSNWEILVESQICFQGKEFLEVYGEGADCNVASSRVWLPDAQPTHKIIVLIEKYSYNLLKDNPIVKPDEGQIIFDRFVSWDGERYGYNAPLDYLLADKAGEELLLPLEHVKFSVCRI
ncbi:hypothetical protein P3339_13755 [Microbulbifer sp. MLAF003]|uniref:hypothetical protein n=1 Tax=Microbulbifer sp. MLAF003 TaxID=3032582 RepID=UPI0024AD7184|nr:hypothetical protein [Microbulbifer sp. MLAF003]WHI49534.1 hypothetical protein P3339_13755 [Microbulbifer sp. MLAF003]